MEASYPQIYLWWKFKICANDRYFFKSPIITKKPLFCSIELNKKGEGKNEFFVRSWARVRGVKYERRGSEVMLSSDPERSGGKTKKHFPDPSEEFE